MATANIFIKHPAGSDRAAIFRSSVCLSWSGLIQQISASVYIISLITLVTEERRIGASLRGGNARPMTQSAPMEQSRARAHKHGAGAGEGRPET